MKKSTYILIGFIAFLALAAFIAPPLLFKKSDNNYFLTNSEKYTTTATAPFSYMAIESKWLAGDKPEIILKMTADSVPSVELNNTWKEFSEISVKGDSLLIQLKTTDENESYFGRLDSKGMPVAVINIPADSLCIKLNRDHDYVFEGINGRVALKGDGKAEFKKSSLRALTIYGNVFVSVADSSTISSVVAKDRFELASYSTSCVDDIFLLMVKSAKLQKANFKQIHLDDYETELSLNTPATIIKE